MRLPPPDPLSIILLYVAAIVMALKEALAPGSAIAAKVPALTMAGAWSYVPAILLCIVAVIWIARGARAPHAPFQPHDAASGQVAPASRSPLLAHEPLDSGQVHHLLYMGMFFFVMIAMSAMTRCHETTPTAADKPGAVASASKK